MATIPARRGLWTAAARLSGHDDPFGLHRFATGTSTSKTQRPGQRILHRAPIPGVKHVVAVGSGKGGVGKTSVAVNLAAALARRCGLRVGLLDADIQGPSVPQMLGVDTTASEVVNVDEESGLLAPARAHGVSCMSSSLLVPASRAVVWRGALVAKAVGQLLADVRWGGTDVLLVDLPPGTGDIALTLSQHTPVSAAFLVSTPQDVALADTVRAADMFLRLRVPVAGIVQNMAYLVCSEDSTVRHELFAPGTMGGVSSVARKLGVDVVADVEVAPALSRAADLGLPVQAALEDPRFTGDSAGVAALRRVDAQYTKMARNLASLLKLPTSN